VVPATVLYHSNETCLKQALLLKGKQRKGLKKWGCLFATSGLILPTKKDRKIFCILSKFSVFCKILQKFKVVFLWKIYRKKNTEFLPATSTKKSVQNFYLFYRKNLSVSNFPVYTENRIFLCFANGRIEPWCQYFNLYLQTEKSLRTGKYYLPTGSCQSTLVLSNSLQSNLIVL
jgi:hypothetical protein